jgi:hypothetical protein
MRVSRTQGDRWALSGVLFVAFFVASLVLLGACSLLVPFSSALLTPQRS